MRHSPRTSCSRKSGGWRANVADGSDATRHGARYPRRSGQAGLRLNNRSHWTRLSYNQRWSMKSTADPGEPTQPKTGWVLEDSELYIVFTAWTSRDGPTRNLCDIHLQDPDRIWTESEQGHLLRHFLLRQTQLIAQGTHEIDRRLSPIPPTMNLGFYYRRKIQRAVPSQTISRCCLTELTSRRAVVNKPSKPVIKIDPPRRYSWRRARLNRGSRTQWPSHPPGPARHDIRCR